MPDPYYSEWGGCQRISMVPKVYLSGPEKVSGFPCFPLKGMVELVKFMGAKILPALYL
jgi:hypothetical protein